MVNNCYTGLSDFVRLFALLLSLGRTWAGFIYCYLSTYGSPLAYYVVRGHNFLTHCHSTLWRICSGTIATKALKRVYDSEKI